MIYRNVSKINKLPINRLRRLAQEALREDIGRRDITTELTIPKNKFVKAFILAKEDVVICGLGMAFHVFLERDRHIKFKPLVSDGQFVKKGKIVARIEGQARSILSAERVALNFLCWLSGVATQTKKYADKVRPYQVKIMDTRKTIPGLRELQKYAVRAGGGFNHRVRLDEMVLVKDNHIKVTKVTKGSAKRSVASPKGTKVTSLGDIIRRIRKKIPREIKIEIEVKNIREFKEALVGDPDIIMLDNMKINDIRKAIEIKRNTQYAIRNTLIEASGGITLENVKKVASTGVDMISIGALTHSLKSADISLEVL